MRINLRQLFQITCVSKCKRINLFYTTPNTKCTVLNIETYVLCTINGKIVNIYKSDSDIFRFEKIQALTLIKNAMNLNSSDIFFLSNALLCNLTDIYRFVNISVTYRNEVHQRELWSGVHPRTRTEEVYRHGPLATIGW